MNPNATLNAAEQLLVGLLQFTRSRSFLNHRGFPLELEIVFGNQPVPGAYGFCRGRLTLALPPRP
jgi:hypothetical protein